MSRADPQATFRTSIKNKIQTRYNYHCAICLQKLPQEGSQCAQLLNAQGIANGIRLGLLPSNYKCSAAENGMLQCAFCNIHIFTPNYFALSPPRLILEYAVKYLQDTARAERLPLYKVFDSMYRAVNEEVSIPESSQVLPYLGLYSLVPLEPITEGVLICTPRLPHLSVLEGPSPQFVPAPSETDPGASNAARIFDVLGIPNDGFTPGSIPLSPAQPEFNQQRYWRLPIKPGAILSALMERIGLNSQTICEEVRLVRLIVYHLIDERPVGPVYSNSSNPGRQDDISEGQNQQRGRCNDSKGDAGGWCSGSKQRGSQHSDSNKSRQENTVASHDSRGETGKQPYICSALTVLMLFLLAADSGDTLYTSDDGRSENWVFGPHLSTNMIVFERTGRVLNAARLLPGETLPRLFNPETGNFD